MLADGPRLSTRQWQSGRARATACLVMTTPRSSAASCWSASAAINSDTSCPTKLVPRPDRPVCSSALLRWSHRTRMTINWSQRPRKEPLGLLLPGVSIVLTPTSRRWRSHDSGRNPRARGQLWLPRLLRRGQRCPPRLLRWRHRRATLSSFAFAFSFSRATAPCRDSAWCRDGCRCRGRGLGEFLTPPPRNPPGQLCGLARQAADQRFLRRGSRLVPAMVGN
jgi:hypothetical protein